jgi:hypothetical protein
VIMINLFYALLLWSSRQFSIAMCYLEIRQA